MRERLVGEVMLRHPTELYLFDCQNVVNGFSDRFSIFKSGEDETGLMKVGGRVELIVNAADQVDRIWGWTIDAAELRAIGVEERVCGILPTRHFAYDFLIRKNDRLFRHNGLCHLTKLSQCLRNQYAAPVLAASINDLGRANPYSCCHGTAVILEGYFTKRKCRWENDGPSFCCERNPDSTRSGYAHNLNPGSIRHLKLLLYQVILAPHLCSLGFHGLSLIVHDDQLVVKHFRLPRRERRDDEAHQHRPAARLANPLHQPSQRAYPSKSRCFKPFDQFKRYLLGCRWIYRLGSNRIYRRGSNWIRLHITRESSRHSLQEHAA
jgi:hypothetical protein